MRITFICPPPNKSGGNRVVAIYARRLLDRGHDVRMVARSRMPPTLRGKLRSLVRGVRPRHVMPGNHYDLMNLDYSLVSRSGPLRDADVPDGDVVIATWWETARDVAGLSPAKGRKVYFVQHHEVLWPHHREAAAASYRLPLKKIAIAPWLVDVMAETYGDRDVDLVENSVDLALFDAPPRGRAARPTVGLVYSRAAYKGLEVAREALLTLRERVPGLAVVAFGTKPMRPDDPLAAFTEFHHDPPQASLRGIYARCDVFLCASHSEGFGLPILEAMACRCPVVSTDVGVARSAIEPGVSGHVVPPGDAEGLVRGLEAVLALDDAAWRRASEAAYRHTHAYSWDDATDRFEAALRRAVEAETEERGTGALPRTALRGA